MSQEKVDARKKSKGDLLHSTKVRMRNMTLIIAILLIVAGAFGSVVCYRTGYNKGEKKGAEDALQSFFNKRLAFYIPKR